MRAKAPVQAKPEPLAAPSFTAAPTGLLQRKCACGASPGLDGECAECRRKRTLGLQTRLAVNAPGDPLEQEADRVADLVARMPDLRLQRQVDEKGEEEETLLQTKPLVQRRFTDGDAGNEAPPIVHEVLRSPGQPLDRATRAFMESRFGHDFSRVRVHTDAKAAESALAVNALAYTVGRNVVFGLSQFAPTTYEGRRLLAHELAHVVQQGHRAPHAGPSLGFGKSKDSFERNADTFASSVMNDSPGRRTPQTSPLMIQRQPRERAVSVCPGTRTNYKILATGLAAQQFGVGRPKNVGRTTLRIMCYDKSGSSIKGSSKALTPDESVEWYYPVAGTYMIGFFCEASNGVAHLEYDMPIS